MSCTCDCNRVFSLQHRSDAGFVVAPQVQYSCSGLRNSILQNNFFPQARDMIVHVTAWWIIYLTAVCRTIEHVQIIVFVPTLMRVRANNPYVDKCNKSEWSDLQISSESLLVNAREVAVSQQNTRIVSLPSHPSRTTMARGESSSSEKFRPSNILL